MQTAILPYKISGTFSAILTKGIAVTSGAAPTTFRTPSSSYWKKFRVNRDPDIIPPLLTGEEFGKAVLSTLELDDPQSVRKRVGMGKDAARKVIKSGLQKIEYHDTRIAYEKEPLSAIEERLIYRYSNLIIATPAFNADALISQFSSALVQNHLIRKQDRPKVSRSRDKIAVYAIEQMHLTRLVQVDGTAIELRAGASEKGLLVVTATVAEPQPVMMSIFTTSCSRYEWCSPELNVPGRWEMPLELGKDGKLQPLR